MVFNQFFFTRPLQRVLHPVTSESAVFMQGLINMVECGRVRELFCRGMMETKMIQKKTIYRFLKMEFQLILDVVY
jgi:hypothetical protein